MDNKDEDIISREGGYDPIYPGMLVKSIDPNEQLGVLRVLYGPSRDPECLLIDDCGHYHFFNITNGIYKHVKETHKKYRILYGAHHEKGPFYVSDDYYWNEEDFKQTHSEKSWGLVMVIPTLCKAVPEEIDDKKVKPKK